MKDELTRSVEKARGRYASRMRQAEEYGIIVGIITFIASWVYCMNEYGFLLGFGLGWLPSIILAAMAGFSIWGMSKP